MSHPLITAAVHAARYLRDVRAKHDEAFAFFLADMEAREDDWDGYIEELGRAELMFAELRHWAKARISGCDNEDPHPGCLCYECSEFHESDDFNFYARAPRFSKSKCLRAGLESHANMMIRAIGG